MKHLLSVMKSSELALASSLKKHKSLENLQTNDIQEEDEDVSHPAVTCEKKSSGKTSRACGVNESFRAAIDRSYEPDSTNPVDSDGMTHTQPLYHHHHHYILHSF